MKIIIRAEGPQDRGAIRRVNEAAFRQADEADLIDRLRAAEADCLSLVAELGGIVVGHILFTPVIVEGSSRAVTGMGLGPMAVLPEHQRQGVGSLLVEQGTRDLRKRRCPFIVVHGHPDFYPRFGFVPASRYQMASQWDGVPDEAFLVRVLDPTSLDDLHGVARYRPEFDVAARR